MINKPFKIEHLDLINFKLKYPCMNELKAEVYPFERDEAKTYIEDDRVIFACGIKMIRKGVGHCWAVPSVYVDKYPKSFFKEMSVLLDTYSFTMRLHRIQTTVNKDLQKWIEKLGFKQEAVLEQLGSDKTDEYLYKKLY